MMRPLIIMLTLVAIVLGAIFGWKAYVGYSMGQSMAAMVMPPVVVSTATVEKSSWSPGISAVGSLRALQGVNVTAQISGQITELNFDSGMSVEAGDLLLKQYTADDEARLDGLKADRKFAEAELERANKLVDRNLISDTEYDSRKTDVTRTRAAESNLTLIIEQKNIRAPFAGRLGIREVDIGEYVEPGDTLARLESVKQMLVEFPVPQRFIGKLSVGQPLEIISDAWPDEPMNATIRALESQVDKDTRTLRVQGIVDNADERLIPGMFVQVNIVLPAESDVLIVPQSVITYSPYGNSVYVLDETTEGTVARKVFVTTGATRGDQVRVMSGVEAGASVVSAGQQKLRNGSLVVVDNSVPINNEPAPDPANN